MKWKSDVSVERKKEYFLIRNSERKDVAKEDYYIIDAIEQGMEDDNKLNELISKTEGTDAVITGFRLAQFIIDYGDYISNRVGHIIIEP